MKDPAKTIKGCQLLVNKKLMRVAMQDSLLDQADDFQRQGYEELAAYIRHEVDRIVGEYKC